MAAQKTPVGGHAVQPAPFEDDDLSIPVEPAPPVAAAPVASAPTDAPAPASGPALPFQMFAPPRPEGRFEDVSTSPRQMPRASTDTTPLPPPPPAGMPDAPPVEHPRAPAEWMLDRAGAPQGTAPTTGSSAHRKDPSGEEAALLGATGRAGGLAPKKLLIIGGGVAAVALVLIIALTRGGSSKQHGKSASAAKGSAVAMATGGSSATETGEDGDHPPVQLPRGKHGSPTGAVAATGGSADVVGPDETIAGSAEAGSAEGSDAGSDSATPAPAPKHHPTLGGKQVVLEYDNAAHAPPTPAPAPREDKDAVEKARTAYATGNQRLFAGDAAGAVRAYQQALDAYPGYVAGYRGLGLAYAQQGNNAKAVQAFHTYLANAPGARDAALIKKRVTALAH